MPGRRMLLSLRYDIYLKGENRKIENVRVQIQSIRIDIRIKERTPCIYVFTLTLRFCYNIHIQPFRNKWP